MDTVAVARVSGPGQNLSGQVQKIVDFTVSNGIACSILQYQSSGYNGAKALEAFENPQINRAIFTSFDRFSRDELEIGAMMKKRGDKPLTIYFIETDQEFTIKGSSPSTWDKNFTEEIQKGKIASQEKSRKSKKYWGDRAKKFKNLNNAPPGLLRAGKRTLRNIRKIFGYNNQSCFVNHMKRETRKFGVKISDNYIKSLIAPLLNYNANVPTYKLKCCKCNDLREISRELYLTYKDNQHLFECSCMSFSKCSDDDMTEEVPVSRALLNMNVSDEPSLPAGFYTVDYICDKRVNSSGKKEYKVVWDGYPVEDASWLPLSSLKKDSLVLAEIIKYEDQTD